MTLELTLNWTSGLDCLLRNQKYQNDPAIQVELLKSITEPPAYTSRVLERMPPQVLLFIEQLAVLSKFAILYCRGCIRPVDFFDRLFQSCLVLSELRTSEQRPAEVKTPRDFIKLELIGTFGFEDPLASNVLLFASFFEWEERNAKRDHLNDISPAADFTKFFGMTWREYMAAGHFIWAYFRQFRSLESLTKSSIVFDWRKFLRKLKSTAILESWYRQNARDLSDVRALFQSDELPHYSGHWLFPLKQKPLIELPTGKVCCPHLPFLENAIAPGPFYRLTDKYGEMSSQLSQDCRTLFGEFFEEYTAGLFARIAAARRWAFSREVPYGAGMKSSDVFLSDGKNAAFIEVFWSRFRLQQTLLELDEEAITEDLNRLVAKAKQVDRSIRYFRAGKFTIKDIDNGSIEHFFPILVTSFAVPHFIGIIDYIRAALSGERLLEDAEPLLITEVQAFDLSAETLISEIPLFDLLVKKRDHPQGKNLSYMNFLALFGKSIGLSDDLKKPDEMQRIENSIKDINMKWL